MGDMRNNILVRKLEGKRPLGRPWRRWEDNITTDQRETGLEVVDWIHLVHDVVQGRSPVNTIMNLGIL
jgi:hypothetical protein